MQGRALLQQRAFHRMVEDAMELSEHLDVKTVAEYSHRAVRVKR